MQSPTSSKPTVLILGAGANIGVATAKEFRNHGWAVAAVARTVQPELQRLADLVLTGNFADPSCLEALFAETQAKLGAPSAVIYNAYSMHPARLSNPLTLGHQDILADLLVNVVSAYEAARLAVASWQAAPPVLGADQRTPAFLFTGNMENTQIYPAVHSLGIGKNAAAYFLETAANAYRGRFRFYYVDERTEAGESVMADLDGELNAGQFLALVNGRAEAAGVPEGRQGEWNWTFSKQTSYLPVKDFVNREVRNFALPGLE